MVNLKWVKAATKGWALEKRVRDEQDLMNVEHMPEGLMKDEDGGFLFEDMKKEIVELEKRRMVLLGEKEPMWRLKSRALWLKVGDENTKFVQAYAKGRRMGNTI